MENRMPTRRCARGKIPCQQIQNIFTLKKVSYSSLIPENILKCLPLTQKISCQFIEKSKMMFPKKSNLDSLHQIRDNMKLQFQEIMKLVQQEIQPNNVFQKIEQKALSEVEKEVQNFESPIRKTLKRDGCTRQVLEEDDCKNEEIFAEQKIIDRLEDYLSID